MSTNTKPSNSNPGNKASTKKTGAFNKYRGLLIAISLFLIFNLSVLALNFYTSSTLNNDAVSINLSGRQRMLSQRTTKVLLAIQVDAAQGQYNSKNNEELKKVVSLFDSTLNGFKNGGTVIGGDDKPVELKQLTDANAIKSVDEALGIWQPYKRLLEPVMNSQIVDEVSLDAATVYARANNLKLLKLMNDLTTQLEKNTKAKATNLQLIQTIALVLSLLLFANIVFNALRKLRASDGEIEKAQRETSEILHTVKEGLFLLDHNLKIGSQFSSSLTKVMQHDIEAGMEFMPLLKTITDEEVYQSAHDYITLLFGSRVKENLVASLNPLSQVKVSTLKIGSQNNMQTTDAKVRYLSFQFNRVVEDKQVLHLLVTVHDVTEQVTQAQELSHLKGQTNINMDLLNTLLQNNHHQLEQFLNTTETGLTHINELLASANQRSQSPKELINACFRTIHSIKGEAATLGIISIETSAHQFETHLVQLRDKAEHEASDILSLPIKLTDLFKQVSDIKTTFELLNRFIKPEVAAPKDIKASQAFTQNMAQLAQRVSDNQHKQVAVECNLELLNILDPVLVSELQQVSVQLIRNSITHGIESPDIRVRKGKPVQGKIIIGCANAENDSIVFSIRDDGQGIVPDRIRNAMIASGKYTEEQVAELSNQAIMQKLFEPGFSTSANKTSDAGHGVGLDVVQTKIKALGGELKTQTRADEYTLFTIHLAQPALAPIAAQYMPQRKAAYAKPTLVAATA